MTTDPTSGLRRRARCSSRPAALPLPVRATTVLLRELAISGCAPSSCSRPAIKLLFAPTARASSCRRLDPGAPRRRPGVMIVTRNVDLSVGSVLALTTYLTGRPLPRPPGPSSRARRRSGFALSFGLRSSSTACSSRLPVAALRRRPLARSTSPRVCSCSGWQRPYNACNIPQDFLRLRHGRCGEDPAARDRLVRRAGGRRELLHARDQKQPRVLCDRIGPDAASPLWTQRPPSASSCVPRQMAHWPAGRRPVRLPLRRHPATPASASSWKPSAAVMGGVAIFGGSGSVIGAAIDFYLLAHDEPSACRSSAFKFLSQAIVGLLILGAIVLDRFLSNSISRNSSARRHGPVLDPPTGPLRRARHGDRDTQPTPLSQHSLLRARSCGSSHYSLLMILFSHKNIPHFFDRRITMTLPTSSTSRPIPADHTADDPGDRHSRSTCRCWPAPSRCRA